MCKRSCSLNQNEADDPIKTKRHTFFDSEKKILDLGLQFKPITGQQITFKKEKTCQLNELYI